MSKNFRPFPLVLIAIVEILQFFTIGGAQDVALTLRLDVNAASVRVEGRDLNVSRRDKRNLSFLREYAGTIGLAERISGVEVSSAGGSPIAIKRLQAGEYLAAADIFAFGFDVSLRPVGRASARAHISWLDGDRGILFLGDMLPQTSGGVKNAARVSLDLPAGWSAVTAEPKAGDGYYNVADTEKAVFVICKKGSARTLPTTSGSVNIFDAWQFSDSDAAAIADEITGRYEKIFGAPAGKNTQITIMRLPAGVRVGNWEADTRGRSVTILSSDMPFRSQSVQRLHEQLRHEIFHLWFPNGVNFEGNYDWFYEGFALYQSLKIGIGGNRLRFTDFLDSLVQAYNLDAMQTDRYSLIEASLRRWNGANTTVYARGMLVAFLCDLTMLRSSRGRLSVDDLLREIYRAGSKSASPANGNDTVIAAMRAHPELMSIVDKYVNGADIIDWRADLLAAGIIVEGENSPVRLTVVPKPNGRQRDLLDKLGYNNWRNLSESSK